MEENKVVKYEGGVIKHVSNAIKISNQLIQEFEITNANKLSEDKKIFLETLNKLPEDQQSKIRKRLAVTKIIQDHLDKTKRKGNNEK